MNLLQELSEEKIKNLYEENGRSNISLVSLVNAKVVHGLHHEFLESPIASTNPSLSLNPQKTGMPR